MGQITRCPLVGTPCSRPIEIRHDSFFLAEPEKPPEDKDRRRTAINTALAGKYTVVSALDEKGINAFTCKICEMIQASAYGIADIKGRNENVLFELGMMIALGKPTIILEKKDEEKGLRLPSDLNAIEVVPFSEYIDLIRPLEDILPKLPMTPVMPSPIEDVERVRPEAADELRRAAAQILDDFRQAVAEAELDTVLRRGETAEIAADMSDRLQLLAEKVEDISRLGLVADWQTAFLRGNYFYNRGEYRRALAAYNRSLDLEPDDSAILNNRGITYDSMGWYEEALADYNRSLELRPDDASTLTNRGVTYFRMGRYEEALADHNRSLDLEPDDPAILKNRGATYDGMGRYEEALADHNRSLELRPNDAGTLTNRGLTYSGMGRYEEALADHNRSLELGPGDAVTLSNRGVTYSRMGRYEEALADYSRSLELGPGDAVTLSNRGSTYSRMGWYEEALADFNRSLELRPDDADTLYNMACLFSLWGKRDDAVEYLAKAIAGGEKYRQEARTDRDFASIRDDPRFKALLEPD